jgi:hypothetical protein
MTCDEFQVLDEAEQINLLGAGERPGERTAGDIVYTCYSLQTFYVEIRYD